MGKANLPENAAVAKQCQVVSLTSSATKWSSNSKKFWKFFQHWWAACSGSGKSNH